MKKKGRPLTKHKKVCIATYVSEVENNIILEYCQLNNTSKYKLLENFLKGIIAEHKIYNKRND